MNLEFKKSYILNNVHFTTREMTFNELLKLRRSNLKITRMIWIKRQPKFDMLLFEWYQPQTPILLFLN